MESYTSYLNWLEGVPGSRNMVIAHTDNNFVHLSTAAHIFHEEIHGLDNFKRKVLS